MRRGAALGRARARPRRTRSSVALWENNGCQILVYLRMRQYMQFWPSIWIPRCMGRM